ncbi:MAG: helix-turn-helix domain-containing protein [Flavobacteriaceae bacterium]
MFSAQYQTEINETFTIAEVGQHEMEALDQMLQGEFCIVWNVGEAAVFFIDDQLVSFKHNCVLFLTEANVVEHTMFTSLRVIRFNSAFFCGEQKHADLDCQGVLFFGASNIPKILLEADGLSVYQWGWKWLVKELQQQGAYKLEMLQNVLDVMITMSTRTFKLQNIEFMTHNFEVDIIREYHYLVEKHYKTLTTVEAYAKMLAISPKSLSNIFRKYDDRTPKEVIRERRQLQAVRMLKNTSRSIKEIANELSFSDIYTFSRFFKMNAGISPSHYRKKIKGT